MKTCKTANVLTVAAVAAWTGYALLALCEVQGSARQAALGLAGALTVISVVVTVRQVSGAAVRTVTVAVAAAPREAYYRGYGDAAQDALGGGADDDDDSTDLRNP
ncbi:hypothetical protein ABZ793_06320 [Micromonospora sp. NPDC047465]|uniref:hypothetical protein n=1 Tax=Micromonospora sp. NPDC047465 TaxID=3154813 RepID=UPI0033C1EF8B